MKETRAGMRIAGASIAWIVLYGALCGVTALVPIFPYVGGGGYVPLQNVFSAMAPLLLGPLGGFVAAVLGGLIGMFIAPAAFPLQLVDVILTGALPALFVALVIHNDRWWKYAVPLAVLVGIFGTLFPFYVPGPAAGFSYPPQPTQFLLAGYYWIIPLIVLATPLGRRLFPTWARSSDRRLRYLGIFFSYYIGMLLWFLPWSLPYWYVFKYEVALGIATYIGYTWWVPAFAAVTTIITIPLLEALSRSGLPRIPDALW
ncbi:MAG: hypothetical protein NZM16_09605 [Thermoflexus sp.]|uniref:hypothetical protein n=1 Tax=Thermoflexus sp. TaxID=1969742 RepID=UPI0025CCE2D3|nr:hypothetical protein [Thermoflexus sp.]MCS6964288.1 hypothetical protein [Thermoflexus sp.]MDW8185805.1 hypothetical protein [Anaerolineae bacterium]